MRERAAAVVAVALRRLLEHGRRGRLGALWEAALSRRTAAWRAWRAANCMVGVVRKYRSKFLSSGGYRGY